MSTQEKTSILEVLNAADLRQEAWRDFILIAMGDPEILFSFERVHPGCRNVIREIEAETQANAGFEFSLARHKFFCEFAVWATQTYWDDDVPDEYWDIASANWLHKLETLVQH